MDKQNLEGLLKLDILTKPQRNIVEAVIKHGSHRKAAIALNCHPSHIDRTIATAGHRATIQGWSPEHDMTKTAPSPMVAKGVSTLYGAEGEVKLQWVKTSLDRERAEEAIRQWVNDMAKGVRGKSPKIKPPIGHADKDLLAVYPMGDPHFGMYAWAAEAGADFDTDIAERLTMAAIDRLVESAPAAERALIVELGDFFHADNSKPLTPGHGNILDVDTRWARVMQIGLRAMVYVIERALAKHKQVDVRIVSGNHDPHASFALALALDAFFRNNKRVKVDLSPAAHWYYRFGKVLIGATHGDTTKGKDLPGVMAADRAEDWGKTVHRYWYCGHVHHKSVEEYPGVMVEYFRTLAARDSWHTGKGYRSGRDMNCIVIHAEHGEVGRNRYDVGMFR